VAQYMTDTGQSLFHLGYRRGGTTRRMAFQEARDPKDAISLNHAIFGHSVYDDYWKFEARWMFRASPWVAGMTS
jgi:hypothetical protein